MKKWFKFISVVLLMSITINSLPIGLLSQTNKLSKLIEINDNVSYESYLSFFDNMTITETEEGVYQVVSHKRINDNFVSGVKKVNDLGEYAEKLEEITETLDTTSEVLYNPSKEYMDIDLSITDDQNVVQEVNITANPKIEVDGSITGTVDIDGSVYNIAEVMEISSETDIEECSLTAIAIFVIVGAIIGATVGGVGAYYAAKATKQTVSGAVVYVIGGVIVGSIVGGCIGLAVGQLGSVVFPKIAALAAKITPATGHITFDKLKAAMGGSKVGYQFHHLVAQGYNNVTRFGVLMIQNTKNVVVISNALHQKLNGYYNSKLPDNWNGLTFGEFMSTKSYSEQYQTNVKLLIKFAEQLGEKVKFN